MKTLYKSIYLSLVYLFLYLPLTILFVFSFNNARLSLIWHGASLHWYKVLFADHDLWIALLHSLLLASCAAIFSTAIGLLAAVSLYRYRFLGRQVLQMMVFLLIIIPDIVMGIALLLLFNILPVQFGFQTLLLAHISFCIPFVIVMLSSRLSQLDPNLIMAAEDLGASEWVIFRKILIGLLWPALLSSMILAFTLSFDDVIISYFVSGPGFEILPLKIYAMARLGIQPELSALCSVIFISTFLLVASAQWLIRRRP